MRKKTTRWSPLHRVPWCVLLSPSSLVWELDDGEWKRWKHHLLNEDYSSSESAINRYHIILPYVYRTWLSGLCRWEAGRGTPIIPILGADGDTAAISAFLKEIKDQTRSIRKKEGRFTCTYRMDFALEVDRQETVIECIVELCWASWLGSAH